MCRYGCVENQMSAECFTESLHYSDFPSVEISSLIVRTRFTKLEAESVNDLDEVKARMGHHPGECTCIHTLCPPNSPSARI